VINLFKGIFLSVVGLSLFLQGVKVGFMPVGTSMGRIISGFEHLWVVIPIGFLLDLVATVAEPAVRILSYNVEKASAGSLKQRLILITLSLGVGIFVALGLADALEGRSAVQDGFGLIALVALAPILCMAHT
jgi:hypothetical protein